MSCRQPLATRLILLLPLGLSLACATGPAAPSPPRPPLSGAPAAPELPEAPAPTGGADAGGSEAALALPGEPAAPAPAAGPLLAWVNPVRCLPGCGAEPESALVPVDDGGAPDPLGSHRVAREIQAPLAALIAAGRSAGHQLRINSAYRSHAEQARLFRSVKQAGRVARPGHSEHQLGTAVDLYLPTPADGDWVASHAPRFGFTLSYPADKQRVTGYRPEPWHIRHVGPELAGQLARQGIALEELFQSRPELARPGGCQDCEGKGEDVPGGAGGPPPCGKVTEAGGCRGPVLTWCYQGALARVDCSTFGKRCTRAPAGGVPDCR